MGRVGWRRCQFCHPLRVGECGFAWQLEIIRNPSIPGVKSLREELAIGDATKTKSGVRPFVVVVASAAAEFGV